MFKKWINTISEALQEAFIGVSVLIGLSVFSIFATLVSLMTFLFCTPVGWIILIILVAKHC